MPSKPTRNRTGKLTNDDKAFIEKNVGLMNPSEIAVALKRNVKTIAKYIKDNGLMKSYVKDPKENVLSKTPYWRELSLQFDERELELFEYHWLSVTQQFKDDVLHTEELQILDMIKMEVLMNRALTQQASVKRRLAELEEEVAALKLVPFTQRDNDEIHAKEAQIAALYTSYDALNKDHMNMQKTKGDMFKNLKATREQRYKQIENSKESLMDWIKNLIENKEKRKQAGIEMEKMRLAMQVEYERLSDYHEYGDGVVERPILNSKTVTDDDKKRHY